MISRRTFLRRGATVGAAAAFQPLVRQSAANAVAAEAGDRETHSIRLGAPVFNGPSDPEALALVHRELGYRAAYAPGIPLTDTDRIRAFRNGFAKHDVVFAEVGRWVNLTDPDPARRKVNLEKVVDGLALAEEIGALCCVDIAGSKNPDVWYGPHQDNLSPGFFDQAVENARKIIDAVKPRHAKFAYEMMGWSIPDSVDSYVRLLAAVDRKAFGVHLDPCNIVNSPSRFYRNAELIDDCFDRLGERIVSCHAKDLTWDVEMNVHFREVRPGTGAIDYTTYLKRLAALPHRPPLMIEHLPNAEEYHQATEYIQKTGKELGLSFG